MNRTRMDRVAKGAAALLLAAAAVLVMLPKTAPAQSGRQAAPAGNANNGKQLFVKYGCYECHGREAQGGAAGPRIGPNPPPYRAFLAYVRHPANQMPPFTEKVVSDAELTDIYAFLQSRPKPKPVKDIPLLNN